MLKRIHVNFEEQKRQIYQSEFDQKQDLWIVGDLRTKLHMQEVEVAQNGFFLSDSILRVRDFWEQIFKRQGFDHQIVSHAYLTTWLDEVLIQNEPEESLLKKQSANFYVELMSLLSPLFFDPDGPSRLSQYFAQHPEGALRWQDWSEITFRLFQVVTNQKKILLQEWLPGFLIHHPSNEGLHLGYRNIFVDIGPDLKQTEAQLFKHLSQNTNVNILEPKLEEEESRYRFLFAPYEVFGVVEPEKAKPCAKVASSKIQARIFSTELAELKFIVGETRRLIDAGAKPQEITWFFADVEKVWPALEVLAQVEGIQLDRPSRLKVKSKSELQKWVGRLKVMAGSLDLSDLEPLSELDFLDVDQKRAYLKNITEIEELLPSIKKVILSLRATSQPMSADDFAKIAYQKWPVDFIDHDCVKCIEKFLSSVHLEEVLPFTAWLKLLLDAISKLEFEVGEFSYQGVRVLNYSEWSLSEVKYGFVASMIEGRLSKKEPTLIRASEFDRLGWDFGYFLDHPAQSVKEADLKWILQNTPENLYLTTFQSDLSASVQSAHFYFLSYLDKKVESPVSTVTVWDWGNFYRASSDPIKIHEEHSVEAYQPIKPLFDKIPVIGVTTFESFAKCPFKFAAQKRLMLKDLPDQDLDLDLRSEGSLYHKLMELALSKWDQIAKNPNFSQGLVSEAFKDAKIEQDSALYQVQIQKALVFLNQFIQFEEQYRASYPEVKVFGVEKPILIYLHPESGVMQLQVPDIQDGWIGLKGIIDRIDIVGNTYFLVDYKRNFRPDYDFKNWGSSCFFQLALYGWALELGALPELKSLRWGGAEIISYSKMRRGGGFLLSETYTPYAAAPRPVKTPLTYETLREQLDILKIQVCNHANQFIAGEYAPNVPAPLQRQCEYCHWRQLCRAPHLNI